MVSESPCRTGKPGRATGLKGKVVWPGVLSPAPNGRFRLAVWTGKDRKVSSVARRLSPTSDRRKMLAVWMGKPRRPWGGRGMVAWPRGSH